MKSEPSEDTGATAFGFAALFAAAAAAAFIWGELGMVGVFVLVLLSARMLGVGHSRRRRYLRKSVEDACA